MSPRRGLLLLLLACTVGGAVVALVYGAKDGLLTALLLLGSGAPVILGAHLLAARRSEAGSLSRQLVAGVGMTVVLVTLGVGAVALLMFISAHDAFIMGLLLVYAGALTAYSLSVMSHGVIADIATVRNAVRAAGAGRRDIKIEVEAGDEIAELAGAANTMVAQLAEREAERDTAESARKTLIAAVSHDLRTPLTSLRLLADAIEDDLVDRDTRRRYLEQMSLHISSLSALIEDMFELSRLEAGDIQWSVQQVALDELVEETVEAMRPQADEKQVMVKAIIGGGLAPAKANPEKLQRVLFNLIQNAIRHTPADGSITVAAETAIDHVEVEVADTGVGMPPSQRERAFEPFFRGGAGSARAGESTGLGLTICRAIVEAHGGKIWFADSAGGTVVRFSLPRAA
jgi:signal transduction histidine kinase